MAVKRKKTSVDQVQNALDDPLMLFHESVREWFHASFTGPTRAQSRGWPAIASGQSTLILAPTGSGKTLTAFLWCVDRLMFSPVPSKLRRCRVLYISPLKALAVDVERNLQSPLVGIANHATTSGTSFHFPTIAIRTGDTPPRERARFQREPADILITTPESLFLLLTSNARETLRSVETVIVDEIHALVPTKRGAHLALSLERLEELADRSPQRIGLSATQRPLDEVARFLVGAGPSTTATVPAADADVAAEVELHDEFETKSSAVEFRPVTIVDTEEKKRLDLRVEVPVEELARLGTPVDIPSGPASAGPARASIWPAIHPRLLELIRAHKSTLIFVNSRRLAERLAGALNELAGEVIVNAHHGSIAREQRVEIEDRLKQGKLPALVATSSLELGIDMGAIDLVIQIEAPPSIASGMQRIGRASHQVGAASKGIIFPKFRGDLVACAAVTDAMKGGHIEATRYPRNPLDIVAQHVVAMTSMDPWTSDALFQVIRQAAPFVEMSRSVFDGVLDMLSGVYPSDEFAELRPRITWNRLDDSIVARPGAKHIAVVNGGTIPDRGLYGVFLGGAERGSARVGELDEEMIFESRVGETFLLGASTWRIEEITHDRVIVSPAPGEPGKMPFWHGDMAERGVEFGERIGRLIREVGQQGDAAIPLLESRSALDRLAAANLVDYLREQREATEVVPDDQSIVIERVRDELGDWRVCVLTPFGGRVHAPWAMGVIAKVRAETAIDVEAMWGDDGFVIRFPETDEPPSASLLLPDAEEIERLVVRQLGATALFSARFRENATRALLLPKRRPGGRAPLWQQRKRAADLLGVAARFGSFPILLETYRECLRDIFDIPSLVTLLRKLQSRTIRVVTADTDRPSPFAAAILFRYVANYIYDGDAPLAERRAQALSIDQAQLRDLLGEVELRELLDADALHELEQQLQHLDPARHARNPDALHDLLLRIGDLTRDEIAQRCENPDAAISELMARRRILPVTIAGELRLIAAEDAARYRDALGVPLPTGVAERLLQRVTDPLGDLVNRYARTHGPFTSRDVANRLGLGVQVVEGKLAELAARGRVIEGEFRPGGTLREFCDAEVLRIVRRKSLARLRKEVEPVEAQIFGRLLTTWQGVVRRKRGLNSLLDVIETLQGYPIPASLLESEILPARIENYASSDLDTLASAGEIVWRGLEPLGEHDGRIALFLTDSASRLAPPPDETTLTGTEAEILQVLQSRGASFFSALHDARGGGYPNETLELIWSLVWKGFISNDTFQPLRSYVSRKEKRRRGSASSAFQSRRTSPFRGEGRWTLVPPAGSSSEERALALAHNLLGRYGVVTRESAKVEAIRGGFSGVYDVLKLLEEAGRVRRGYFVAGVAATQFALPGAVDLLRSLRVAPDVEEVVTLAAADPANPYGALLPWPGEGDRNLMRTVGARVVLINGALRLYIARGEKSMRLFLPEDEPDRARAARFLAKELAREVVEGHRRARLIAEIDGQPSTDSYLASFLEDERFVRTSLGHQLRQQRRDAASSE